MDKTADLFTLTTEIFSRKLHLLCIVRFYGSVPEHKMEENVLAIVWNRIPKVSQGFPLG